uniref:Uncharacterized protein n=1 Tax=Amphiprion percula TaxID=161767 RepID=A0A3P8T9B5_AMPPE
SWHLEQIHRMLRWFFLVLQRLPPPLTQPHTHTYGFTGRQWDYRPVSMTSLSNQPKSTIYLCLGHMT